MRKLTRTQKLALGGAAAYLAVPILMRLSKGCPPFGIKVGSGTPVAPECRTITAAELFLWPLGFFAPRK